jgi:hypothetical protein
MIIAARLVILMAGVVALSGCAGYRVGNTSGRDLQGVRSVYVPTAKNTSLSPDLQMTVTNAIIRRFNDDGTLEVNQSQFADSELDVVITDVTHTPIRSSVNDILVTASWAARSLRTRTSPASPISSRKATSRKVNGRPSRSPRRIWPTTSSRR